MEQERIIGLVTAAQNGDSDALGALLEDCYQELYYFAYTVLKDQETAADVTQDALIQIMQDLPKLHEPKAFLRWAKQITYHTCTKELKKHKPNVSLNDEAYAQILETAQDNNAANRPEEVVEQLDTQKIVMSFLDQLSPEQRSAIAMHYFNEMSINEIAEVQGISVSTAKERLANARNSIKTSVEDYERDNDISLYGGFTKKIHDVFISYSQQDCAIAEDLKQALEAEHIAVYSKPEADLIETDWVTSIRDAISNCRIIVALVTESSVKSAWCKLELDSALQAASNRSKAIVPVCLPGDILESAPDISFLLAPYQQLRIQDASPQTIQMIVGHIRSMIHQKASDNVLYEKLSEYISAGLNSQATETLCLLINKLCEKISGQSPSQRSNSYLTLLSYLEKMEQLYDYTYGQAGRTLAHKKLDALGNVGSLLHNSEFDSEDLYYISIALRFIYFDRVIRLDCADAITGGEVSDGFVKTLPEKDYAQKQEKYTAKYRRLISAVLTSYSPSQLQFIRATEEFIYGQREKIIREPAVQKVTDDDSLLQSVAAFTREGNKLFDIISEKQPARDFLQCLITSYERLKAYCDVVGAKDICAECIERIAELKQKMIVSTTQSTASDKSETGIKTLLGLTIPKSGEYDVFISHKHEDFDLALGIYEFLRENLKEPFIDKVSLPEMSDAKYRKSIMQALDGSKHFIVVLSDLSYLESYWVSLEMEVFLSEIDEGRKSDSNFLIIVTNDVYDAIMATNKCALPIDYRRCEIIRLDDYKSVLLNYLNK